MKTGFGVVKGVLVGLWLLELVNLLGFVPEAYSTQVHWIAGVILVVHALEWLLVGRRVFEASTRKANDFMAVLAFGMAHIAPRVQQQAQGTKEG